MTSTGAAASETAGRTSESRPTMASDHTYTDQQVAAEASARTSADNAEASARQSADTTLQANIDAMELAFEAVSELQDTWRAQVRQRLSGSALC